MKPRNTHRRNLSFPAFILAGALATHTAQAAPGGTWDGGGADANWSTIVNWVGDAAAAGATSGTTNSETAFFNTAIANTWGLVASPIIIDLNRNLRGISFGTAADNYFIGTTAGNPLLLTSAGTIQILNTLSTTNAVETISSPLVIEGAGGTYTLANNSANGSGAGTGTLALAGAITGGAAGATVLSLDGSNTNANTLSGIVANGSATTLGITKNGAGTWHLTNAANTFTGPIVVNTGTLAFGALTVGATQTLTLSGGTLSAGSGDAAVNLNTPATGSGELDKVGKGTLTLNNLGASYDGNIAITAAPVKAATYAPDMTVSWSDPSAFSPFGSTVGHTTITNTGTGVIVMNEPSSLMTLAENFVVNAGSAWVQFGGAAGAQDTTYNGTINIVSGTLLSNNGGDRTYYNGVISGAGAMELINGNTILANADSTFSGGFHFGLGQDFTGFFGVGYAAVTGSDTVSGGIITKGPYGTGTVLFDVISSTDSPRSDRSGDWNLPSGTTITLHNTVVQKGLVSFRNFTSTGGTGTALNTMVWTDAGLTVPSTWTLMPSPTVYDVALRPNAIKWPLVPYIAPMINYTIEINQVIDQVGGVMNLRKAGQGTLVLGRANTYGADTLVTNGFLKLGTNNALPTGTKLLLGGGTYSNTDYPELGLVGITSTTGFSDTSGNTEGAIFNGVFNLNGYNQAVAYIAVPADSAVPTGNLITNSSGTAATFTVNNASADSFGGTISGNLSLAKGGLGNLTLNSLPSYTGTTTVNQGTLTLGTAALIGSSPGVILGADGVLDTTLQAGTTMTGGQPFTIHVSGNGVAAGTCGRLTAGALNIDAGTVTIEIDSELNDAVYVLASYTSLTGITNTFASTSTLPPGYTIDYAYAGGTQIAIVGSPVTPAYEQWATDNITAHQPLANATPTGDPDGDGFSNLIEFAFNGDPLDPASNGKVYALNADSDWTFIPNGTKEMILTIAVRASAPAFSADTAPTSTVDTITYIVQGGTALDNLGLTSVWPVTPIDAGLPPAGSGYVYRSFSLDGSEGFPNKGFLRVKVEKTTP